MMNTHLAERSRNRLMIRFSKKIQNKIICGIMNNKYRFVEGGKGGREIYRIDDVRYIPFTKKYEPFDVVYDKKAKEIITVLWSKIS